MTHLLSEAHPADGAGSRRSPLRELRAGLRFYRQKFALGSSNVLESAREDGRRGDPDEWLLDLLEEPFASVPDTYDRLEAAEQHFLERSDRRSVFLTVYVRMTDRVRNAIRSGRFNDEYWARQYLVAFADQYREALIAFERGNVAEVPPPWRVAFGASLGDRTLLVQDALLGINAHINYDLTYSLGDVAIDPNRAAKLADHNRINDVLQRLVDVTQRSLAAVYRAQGYSRLDSLLGSFDEDFTLFGLTESRALAWRNAAILADTSSSLVRRFVHWRTRVISTGTAFFILKPSADPAMLSALRSIEAGELPLADLHDHLQRAVREQTVDTGDPSDREVDASRTVGGRL